MCVCIDIYIYIYLYICIYIYMYKLLLLLLLQKYAMSLYKIKIPKLREFVHNQGYKKILVTQVCEYFSNRGIVRN